MFLVSHGIQVGIQLAVLLFSSAGWGCWVYRLARPATGRPVPGDLLLCGIAGLCLCSVVLQNLVYAGLRLEWSSWLGLAVALGGCVHGWKTRAKPVATPALLWTWLSAGLVVFCFQSAALVYRGPSNYYGNAHQDQINYVQLGQFLIEKPFHTALSDVTLDPWIVKAVDVKDMRITQSVVNGYVAVTTLSDAKVTYGTTSVFFVGLLAAVTTTLLANCGVGRRLAWLGGIWAGLLPAVTQTHLDGFFSQTTVLFVLPALCLAAFAAQRNLWLGWITATLFLAFLLGAYTEVYIIGAAAFVTLCLSLVAWPLRKRIGYGGLAIVVSLLLLTPYVLRSLAFVADQYKTASNPETLAALAPQAGTWRGWAELFMGVPSAEPLVVRAQILAGFCLLGLILLGVASRSFNRRIILLGLLVMPVAMLLILLSAPVLAKYPFGKLLALFTPLAVIYSVLGIARLGLLVSGGLFPRWLHSNGLARPPFWRSSRQFAVVLTGALLIGAASSSVAKLRQVIASGGNLAAVNSAATQAVFAELEAHPERTYLLKEQHVILNAWLCFHARHARVYADVDKIGDRLVPTDQFAFRRLPRNTGEVWLLTGESTKSYAQADGAPEIIVRNPQGIDRAGLLTWYWVGDGLDIEIVNFSSHPLVQQLSMRALSGPANAAAERTVSLLPPDGGERQIRQFAGDARVAFLITLKPGSNFLQFQVDAPKEWQSLPGDARKLMVRIQEISLTVPPQGR